MIGLAIALALHAPVAGWEISSRQDPMTDVITHTATLEEGRQGLIVSCDLVNFQVTYVDLDGLAAYPPRAPVQYRFDDEEPMAAEWFYTSEAARVEGEEARRFLAGLVDAERVRIRASSTLKGSSDAGFAVSGAEDVVADLHQRCGLRRRF